MWSAARLSALLAIALAPTAFSAISLSLGPPAVAACGQVSVNGGVTPSSGDVIANIAWDWGDGTRNNSMFPSVHQYTANGVYSIRATATSQAGESSDRTVTATITTAEDPACSYSVRVLPAVLALRGGQTTGTLRVEIRDTQGRLVPTRPRKLSFTSSNPGVVQVDSAGRVSATGFGLADVVAQVEGLPQTGSAQVSAGHFRVLPPLLYLSPGTHPSGRFEFDAANADGTPLDLSKHKLVTELHGPSAVATMASDGWITAFRAPQDRSEGVSFSASIDGVSSSDNASLRINDPPFDPDLAYWVQRNITYYAPKQAGHLDNSALLPQFQVPETTDAGYLLERQITGVIPWRGDTQFLANVAGPGNPDPSKETLPCGGSGNPVGLGTDISKSHDGSCLWVDVTPVSTQWFVILHEMGHNFTLGAQRFSRFALSGTTQNNNVAYIEGLASLAAMAVSARLNELPPEVSGVNVTRVREIASQMRFHDGSLLKAYLTKGADYTTLDANILDEMLAALMSDYGSAWLYRFFSTFLPQSEAVYPFALSGDTQQSTFFVAAVSAAVDSDLRPRFAAWGFPLDNAYYDQIYPAVTLLAAQRDPVAYAGPDRQAGVNDPVPLDAAEVAVFEPEPVLEWRIVSQPAGADAHFSDSKTLHPVFSANQPGVYRLSLTAGNGILTSAPSILAVALSSPTSGEPCTFSIDSGGEAFPAPGGTGVVNVATQAGCNWVASTALDWVTLVGPASVTGSGSVTFQVSTNSGTARTGAISVAGMSWTLEQASAAAAQWSVAAALPHWVAGGGWQTAVTIANPGAGAAHVLLSFFDGAGAPMPMPLVFGNRFGASLLTGTVLERTLPPGAVLTLNSPVAGASVLRGWLQLRSTASVVAYATFSHQPEGGPLSESLVPLGLPEAAAYLMPFDNTNGASTGIAMANLSGAAAAVTLTVLDSTGAATLGERSFSIPPLGHADLALDDQQLGIPAAAGAVGTVRVSTAEPGQLVLLGLRFNASSAFTTIPALPVP